MCSWERNTEGIRQNALIKRQNTFKRTDEAIKLLLKENKPINFNTVAEASGVSKSWLYREPEVKERIKQLQQRQLKEQLAVQQVKLPEHYKASDNSKDAIIAALKQRIKKQDEEIKELRKQLETAYGLLRHQTR